MFGIQLTGCGQPFQVLLRHFQQLRIVLVTLAHRLRHKHAPQPNVAVVRPGHVEAGEIQVAIPLDECLSVGLEIELGRQTGDFFQGRRVLNLGERRKRLLQFRRRLSNLADLLRELL